MDQSERREYLIKYLSGEQPGYSNMNMPGTIMEQKRLLRSLMNVRMPEPINDDFLKIQDEYLRAEKETKGTVSIEDIQESQPDLYIWRGDITTLAVDAIVNAANSGMTGCYLPCHNCIDTFVKVYVKDAIRKTRAQERGYKSRLDRKRRKIAKAKAKAAVLLAIKEEEVDAEDIYECMPLVTDNPLSLNEIKRTLNEYLVEYSFNDSDNAKEKGIEDKILISEECIEKDFAEFIANMRPMQKYIFLQSYGFCSNKHENMKSNVIGFDPVLVRLGKEDENGQAHIKSDGDEYLEERYIRKEKERITIRMRRLIEKMEYTDTELRTNLMPLLYELQEEMRIRYDL